MFAELWWHWLFYVLFTVLWLHGGADNVLITGNFINLFNPSQKGEIFQLNRCVELICVWGGGGGGGGDGRQRRRGDIV